MNHFNDQAYYGHHLGPQPSSALLLSAGHRFLAAKLAAAAAASSSTSSEQGTSSSSPSNNCKSSLTSSILYSAISAAAAASSAKPSTFAIPQLPPPLVSVNGCGSSQPQLQQQQQQQQSSSSSSFYPNLVSVSSQPRQQQQHHNHHYHHQHQNQQQQQQPRPVDVYAFTEGNSCVGSSTSSAVTSTTSTTRGRGRGRGSSSALGRPPKSRSAAVSASSSSSSAFTSRSYGINGSSAIREPPPPPSAPQVAAVAGAHQNESHNSLAASMPLLSTYLMKGTITGYHNGHQMGKKGNNSYGVAVQQQQQQKQQQANGNCEPVHSNGLSTVCHLNAALESAGLPASQHQHHHKRHNHQQQQQQQRPPSVEVIEESDDDESSDECKAVRFGRVPKREKAKILAAMQKVNAHSLDKALSAVLEDEQCISVTIATAHEETCDYTREKVAPLLEAARSRPVYAQCPPSMTCPLNPIPIGTLDPAQSARILEDFSERFSPAIRGVVDFAKRIPGFGMLSQEDQVTLLKAGVFEVLLVRLACMFDSPSASMVCLNGLVLRRDALHSASNARFLLDSMFDFAERLNSLRLSDHEIGLFCAVVVIAPDRPGLRNVDLVTKINKRLEEVLQKTIAGNHPNDVASGQLIFTELTKKIPDLRTLNTLHSEKLIGKNFIAGESVASSTTNHHHHHHQEMASSGAAAVHSHHSHHSQSSQQQPDSSDNSPSDRWSSSSSLGHFSPATSTEDGRSVSPTSGPWGEHQQKQQQQQSSSSDSQAFGSPRSMSSSSGVSSEDSHSRKGSISLPSAPPKLAYINSYVRGLSSPVVVSSEHGHCPAVVSSEEAAASTASSHYNSSHHLHPYSKPVQHPVNGHHHQLSTTVSGQQQQQQHRVDSPTDSGIDHHSSSVCSSPSRSSAVCPVEESSSKCSKLSVVIAGSSSPRSHSDHSGSALTSSSSDSECSEKQESIDDMPVLKRALQAPPLVNTNKLMDEAYRHHKKFRAAARRDTEPHSPSTTTGHSGSHSPLPSPVATVVTSSPPAPNSSSISSSSLASTHSTLLKTLEQPSRYLSEQQLKRTDLIHNIIMNSEAVTAAAASALSASVPVAAQLSSPVYQHGLFSGASAKDSLYPAGASFYHHAHPHHQMPAVCPFTGRSASVAAAVPSSSASPSSSSSPSTYQLPAHFAKSPEVAAAAAGLLVIGSSVPPPPMVSVSGGAAVPMPSSSSSGQQQHSSPVVMVSPSASYHHQQQTMGSPYSHLARCLTATTAPALVHQRSPASAASPSHHDDQDDAQPLNLSKKAACPAVGSTLRQSSPVISCPSSASSNSLKMEVDA